MADQDMGPTSAQLSSAAISDVYKTIKNNRQEALEERLRSSKEKAQQEMSNQRRMVRNIDPFERQQRREMMLATAGGQGAIPFDGGNRILNKRQEREQEEKLRS